MAPTIPLTGRVVAPDGRSVSAFTIAAGLGKLPSNSDSFRREVQDRDGRFRLDLSKEGTTWVGVAAEGCAAWEGWVDVKRGGEPLVIRLSPGVAVSARVVAPEAMRKHVKARLVPRRDKSEIGGLSSTPYAEEFPTRTATLSADGSLRFESVRPDRYRLIIEGRGIPETVLALDVPGGGLDVGIVRIDVPTTMGRVEGRVWYPKSRGGGVWAFADGYVGGFRFKGLGEDDSRSIAFQADENGHFAVDRVPGGMTTVGFPFQFFDVIDSYRWSALVVEGQTTEVGAFDPEGHREFTLAFAIGDGSKAQYQSGTGLGASRKVDNVTVSTDMASLLEKKVAVTPREPMFRVELVPVSKDPLSFAEPDWEDLDAQRKIVLPDVGPGTYRLRVYDWLGVRDLDGGPLFDRDVVVPPGGRGEAAHCAGCRVYHGQDPPAEGECPAVHVGPARGGDRHGEGESYAIATDALRRRRQLLRPIPVARHLLAVHQRPGVGLLPGGRRGDVSRCGGYRRAHALGRGEGQRQDRVPEAVARARRGGGRRPVGRLGTSGVRGLFEFRPG